MRKTTTRKKKTKRSIASTTPGGVVGVGLLGDVVVVACVVPLSLVLIDLT